MEVTITESASSLGYSQLKVEQREAVRALMEGNNVFVALPTGYGKSIIFASLPGAFDRYKGEHKQFA